ncbi:MAG: DUF1501 domain-containing protein [Planctomycetes bacterium]|jgi:hypothetical protein|nr:DUF1501 domain-containing protein [Planctomycetota bacterium]
MKHPTNPFRGQSCGGALPGSRRDLLRSAWNGFAMLPLAHLAAQANRGSRESDEPKRLPHFTPRAKSVIFLYMDGGPSCQDLFDYKPRLVADDGKPFGTKMEPTQFNNNGNTLGPRAKFRQHGESGQWVSDLLPHLGAAADKLCVVRSMVADFSEHTNANYFLHTGHGLQGRPSMGAWVGYGLGTQNQDLPAFVVLNGGLIPPGGVDCFHSGFLPAQTQGSLFRMQGDAVANIAPQEPTRALQQRKVDLVQALDAADLRADGSCDALEAAIKNHELAFQMQSTVPELVDLSGESERLKSLYGIDDEYEQTRTFARQCMLARRLVERGVRFVELTCPSTGHDRWDQHSNLERGLGDNCRMIDKPIAALLSDLQARGMLDETIVLWGGEFGRTPFAQGRSGRDHNPFGFTMWAAGGGFRPGTSYGATDEFGYKAEENPVSIHELHATVLFLLGIDHEKFTYRFGGRDLRLTDVYGRVITPLLA